MSNRSGQVAMEHNVENKNSNDMEKEIRRILYENQGYGDADTAVKELLVLFSVSKSVFCEDCKHTIDVKLKRNSCKCVQCGGKI